MPEDFWGWDRQSRAEGPRPRVNSSSLQVSLEPRIELFIAIGLILSSPNLHGLSR